jgi:superfamily I DNA and/or RNA helicase
VAITRARKQMILTGNAEILNNDVVFKSLIEYIKKKNGYIEYHR